MVDALLCPAELWVKYGVPVQLHVHNGSALPRPERLPVCHWLAVVNTVVWEASPDRAGSSQH